MGLAITPCKDGDETTAFAKARSTGIDAVDLGWSWLELEEEAGVFATQLLDSANSLYSVAGLKVIIMLNPIESDRRALPPDLETLEFDDPLVISRFETMIETLLQHLSGLDIEAILIGNEATVYLTDNPSELDDYRALVEAASTHIKSIRPGIEIGVQGTFETLFNEEIETLSSALDILALSYYPYAEKEGHLGVPDLAAVEEDLARLVTLGNGKKIYIPELGYSTSGILDSSEEEQRDFVREFFRVWDRHEDSFRYVEFLILHDVDPDWMSELFTVLGLDAHPFRDELFAGWVYGGMRTHDCKDKLAFPAFREEARARGWE
ncbi:hypothetical protein ACFL6C_07200 [Myxococcota bacterium]